VIGIERIAVRVAAPDPFGRERFALLFDNARLPVMARCATGHYALQRRKRIATLCDPVNVVDRDRGS
jgi:hypothetical protein